MSLEPQPITFSSRQVPRLLAGSLETSLRCPHYLALGRLPNPTVDLSNFPRDKVRSSYTACMRSFSKAVLILFLLSITGLVNCGDSPVQDHRTPKGLHACVDM